MTVYFHSHAYTPSTLFGPHNTHWPSSVLPNSHYKTIKTGTGRGKYNITPLQYLPAEPICAGMVGLQLGWVQCGFVTMTIVEYIYYFSVRACQPLKEKKSSIVARCVRTTLYNANKHAGPRCS